MTSTLLLRNKERCPRDEIQFGDEMKFTSKMLRKDLHFLVQIFFCLFRICLDSLEQTENFLQLAMDGKLKIFGEDANENFLWWGMIAGEFFFFLVD
jgi:hypothetical protein